MSSPRDGLSTLPRVLIQALSQSPPPEAKVFSTGGISRRLKNISSLCPLCFPGGYSSWPADKFRIRSGCLPEESKDLRFALGGTFQSFNILGVPAGHVNLIPQIQELPIISIAILALPYPPQGNFCTNVPSHRPSISSGCMRAMFVLFHENKNVPYSLCPFSLFLNPFHIASSSSCPFSFNQAFAFSIVGACARTMFQNLGVWLVSMR